MGNGASVPAQARPRSSTPGPMKRLTRTVRRGSLILNAMLAESSAWLSSRREQRRMTPKQAKEAEFSPLKHLQEVAARGYTYSQPRTERPQPRKRASVLYAEFDERLRRAAEQGIDPSRRGQLDLVRDQLQRSALPYKTRSASLGSAEFRRAVTAPSTTSRAAHPDAQFRRASSVSFRHMAVASAPARPPADPGTALPFLTPRPPPEPRPASPPHRPSSPTPPAEQLVPVPVPVPAPTPPPTPPPTSRFPRPGLRPPVGASRPVKENKAPAAQALPSGPAEKRAGKGAAGRPRRGSLRGPGRTTKLPPIRRPGSGTGSVTGGAVTPTLRALTPAFDDAVRPEA